MKEGIRKNIFLLLAMTIGLMVGEYIFNWQYLAILGLGFLALLAAVLIPNRFLNIVFKYIGIFLIIASLIVLKSFYALLIVIIFLLVLFRTDQGNEFFHFKDAWVFPSKANYQSIQLIQPQSQQRTLLEHQSLFDMISHHNYQYEWDDVNLVYIGGNHILDFGNTLVPSRETTVVIRKIFGNTRVIISNDIGLRINFATISGNLNFEANQYQLMGENFIWQSPGYEGNLRKINMIISVSYGDVEVILT